MNHIGLIWAGLWRRPARTAFTLLALVTAFLLFGVLQGINLSFGSVYTSLDVKRLYVQNKVNIREGLPIAYSSRIASVEGVEAIAHLTAFGGYYGDSRNRLSVFATDPSTLPHLFPDLVIAPEQLDSVERVRTGIIVSTQTAAELGWKIGDNVVLGSSMWIQKDGGNAWQFQIAGIADTSAYVGLPAIFMRYDYLDEGRAIGGGRVNLYTVTIADPRRSAEISNEIDALFANAGDETKTMTERAWTQEQVRRVGDISLIANSIVGAVLFTLLFLTGNTMMQSVRERIPEFAVLKAIGYSDGRVLSMIIAESVILCVSASIIGVTLGSFVLGALPAIFGIAKLSGGVIALAVSIAFVVALLSVTLPVWRAQRMSVVDALAGR